MIGPLRRPQPLQAGDRVAIIAPSGPVEPTRLGRGCEVLTSYGLEVVLAPHLFDRAGPYLAGEDATRAKDFQDAWLDPDVAGILCARGGYGAMRIIDLVDWGSLVAAPATLFAGSSDVTALHGAIASRLGVATLYAPMVATQVMSAGADWSPDRLHAALFGDWRDIWVTAGVPWSANPGRARGVTTGGNLSLLAATIGSAESRPAAGKIVLLEDVGEQPYRIDRLLTQLLRSGWFDGVAGIALGAWVACGDADDVGAVLEERLARLGVPIVGGLPFGHGRAQASIPLGLVAELDTATATLSFAARCVPSAAG